MSPVACDTLRSTCSISHSYQNYIQAFMQVYRMILQKFTSVQCDQMHIFHDKFSSEFIVVIFPEYRVTHCVLSTLYAKQVEAINWKMARWCISITLHVFIIFSTTFKRLRFFSTFIRMLFFFVTICRYAVHCAARNITYNIHSNY